MINKEFLEQLMKRMKIFWTAMILVFFVVSLQYLGLHAPNILPFFSAKFQSMFAQQEQAVTVSSMTTQAVTTTKGGE